MWIGVVSLFPEIFRAISENGVTGRAIKNNLLSIQSWNPRDFTTDKHRTVDDRPYGGGPGMLMMVQPLRDAIKAAKQAAREAGHEAKVIYLSPQGRRLDHCGARRARFKPGFFRSFFRESRVRYPDSLNFSRKSSLIFTNALAIPSRTLSD